MTGCQRNRRRERRRDDAVHHQARAHEVVPDARVAQRRRAVRGMPQSRRDAELRQARQHLLESLALRLKQRMTRDRRPSRNACRPPTISRLRLAISSGSVNSRLSWRKAEPVHAGVDLQMAARAARRALPRPPAAIVRRRASRWSASGCARTRRRHRSRRARRRPESRRVTPALRSTMASSMSAHARIVAPASCSASPRPARHARTRWP